MTTLQAPFPYFGGKSKIAHIVWRALGQPDHYIEPFFGSGAVLLLRPNYQPRVHVETICDKDGFVCNVWRSLQFNPNEVAKWCDWPVNHCDLSARRFALLKNESHLLENLIKDEKWFDPVMAGYWIWAASCWIGARLTVGMNINKIGGIPHLTDAGMGINKISQIPHLTNAGKGINKIGKRPLLSGGFSGGVKVHNEKRIETALCSNVTDPYNINIYKWFRQLSERLRYVRVVCGDWSRVCGGNWQDNLGSCGIFFDPPYSVENRSNVYHQDSRYIAQDVAEWAIERGKKSTYRIVIAGYYEEHERLLSCGWNIKRWKANGGYSHTSKSKDSQGGKNRFKESLFFSPYCKQKIQTELFC